MDCLMVAAQQLQSEGGEINRSLVGIPFLGARNPHCPQYPLMREILVGIQDSGDSR